MKLRTLQYSLVQGLKGMFKNRLMTMASIGIIATCLFLLGISFCIVMNVDNMVENFDDNLGIVAFLKEDTTEEDALALKEIIEKKSQVKTVTYTSPMDAWNNFKGEIEASDEILQQLEKDNPLAGSASFDIFLYDAAQQKEFVNYLKNLTAIRKIDYSQDSIDIFVSFNKLLKSISVVIIGVLLGIAVLLIANTIKVGLYVRRHEINIMKYLGAKDSFIRLPFIVEGILIGIIGAIIPYGIIFYSYDYLIEIINTDFTLLANYMQFLELKQITAYLLPTFMGIGVGIGVLGSGISIHRHLKV